MKLRNLEYIRSIPVFGARLYESLVDVQNQASATEQQTNSNALGQPTPPPAINNLHVSTGPGGEFQLAITDSNKISRGINYWAEHADNPHFNNPHIIDMGQSRNHSVYLGGQSLYWRAYSSYPSSPTSPAVYHGSQAQPAAVRGGVTGVRSASQGAGTGAPGQGLYGPGPVAQRGVATGFVVKQ